MDYELSSEQKDIKAAAREFAEGEFPEVGGAYDEREEYPMELWKKACTLGFIGLFMDERYGGAGLGFLEHLLVLEQFARVDPGCSHILLAATGAELIEASGTEEQKERYLPGLARGDAIMGSVIPDNGAGTDEAVRRMTACREGEAYVINGEQAFVVNGSIADHLVVSCVPAGPAEATNWRSSLFVVGTGSPGCEVFKLKGRLGLRACDAARVRLSGVRVTEKELLGGGEGGGSDRVRPFLDGKRLEAAALSIGIAEGAMEQAVAYARQRRAFGRCVAAFESTQLKVAEMGAYIEASRRLCFEAAWLLDHGRRDSGLVSMAGWFAGMTGIRVVDEALQLHGGYGYITESRIERFFRDATMAENYGGCGESEKVSIGGAVIGPV